MSLIQVLTLLQVAVNLLISANAPGVPQGLKDQAVLVANYSISVANQSMADLQAGKTLGATLPSETTPPAPVVEIVTPTPAPQPTPTPTPQPTPTPPMPSDLTAISYKLEDYAPAAQSAGKFAGVWYYRVFAVDSRGKPTRYHPFTWTASLNGSVAIDGQTRGSHSIDTCEETNARVTTSCWGSFAFIPTETGNYTINVSVPSLSKSLSFNVLVSQ